MTFSQSETLSDGNLFNVSRGWSGDAPVISSQEQTQGAANILIQLPAAATAFSLDYGTYQGGNVTFTLSNGYKSSGSSTGPLYATPGFYGITDTAQFTSVLVTTPNYVPNVNGVAYQTATSAHDPTPVPAPVPVASAPEAPTWTMLIAGFAALAFVAYRRKDIRAEA